MLHERRVGGALVSARAPPRSRTFWYRLQTDPLQNRRRACQATRGCEVVRRTMWRAPRIAEGVHVRSFAVDEIARQVRRVRRRRNLHAVQLAVFGAVATLATGGAVVVTLAFRAGSQTFV